MSVIERMNALLERRAIKVPTADEIEEWWEFMSPGAVKKVASIAKVPTNLSKWNAAHWERVMDYYVQVEMGDPRGYSRGRNV